MRKGDCFDAAYHHLNEVYDDGDRDIALCHGIVTTLNGTFVHAWVEIGGENPWCVDVTNGNHVAKRQEDYYRILSVTGVVRYDIDEAAVQFIRHRHCGPWHPSFDHL